MWLFFAMALYRLLQHAGKNLARAVVIFVVVSVAIAMANMVGTVSYMLHALAQFFAFTFAPGLSSIMVVLETLSEAALLLYLLIKGVKIPAATPGAR